MPSYPSETVLSTLRHEAKGAVIASEFDHLYSQLAGYLGVEHAPDGTHTAVSAVLPEIGWTMGIYRPDGTTVYLASAAAGKSNEVSVTIIQSEDRFLGLGNVGHKDVLQRESRLSITARDGVIVVRAPDKGFAYRAETEQVLSRAGCSSAAY